MNLNKNSSNKSDKVSKEEFIVLLKQARSGNIDARNELIMINLGLVKYRVNAKFPVSRFDKEDLLSIGTFGLIKAVDSYDLERGVNFTTYAVRCIDNEILQILRKKYIDTESLDRYYGNNDMYDFVCFQDVTPTRVVEEDYEKKEMYNIIDSLVSELPELERQVVELYFGFYNEKELPQKDIAKKLSMSQPWVSRTLKKSLKNIKLRIEDMESISAIKEEYSTTQLITRYQVRSNSIYDFFDDYSKEVVDAMLASLLPEERKLVLLRYDKSRGKSVYQRFDSLDDYTRYYNNIVPKMKQYIKEIFMHEENGDTSYDIADIKQIELPNQEFVNIVLAEYSRTEATVVALKFGYYDGKHYTTKEISKLLKLDLPQIYGILKNALQLYKNYLNDISKENISVSI